MKLKTLIIAITIMCGISGTAYSQLEKKTEEVCYNPNARGDTSKRSLKSSAVGKIGSANVTINYYSPGLRKRVIWGGLVPYDEVWVTGAHSATNIEFDKAIMIGDKTIPAGKYAVFTIPGKSLWTVIINKNWDQHLSDDYDEKDDIVRIKVKPVKQQKPMERLQYFINPQTGNKGTIAIGWDQLLIPFAVKTI
jgi:hypothetical protein